jgi:hypothetical protein
MQFTYNIINRVHRLLLRVIHANQCFISAMEYVKQLCTVSLVVRLDHHVSSGNANTSGADPFARVNCALMSVTVRSRVCCNGRQRSANAVPRCAVVVGAFHLATAGLWW